LSAVLRPPPIPTLFPYTTLFRSNNYTSAKSWKAVDACGNTSGTVTQTITVRDTTAPTIGGQGSNATIECPASPSFTAPTASDTRSEEHTSELQSRGHLVCRLLLE